MRAHYAKLICDDVFYAFGHHHAISVYNFYRSLKCGDSLRSMRSTRRWTWPAPVNSSPTVKRLPNQCCHSAFLLALILAGGLPSAAQRFHYDFQYIYTLTTQTGDTLNIVQNSSCYGSILLEGKVSQVVEHLSNRCFLSR